MSRFSSIIYGCVFLIAGLAAADAQATHPIPQNGPMPNGNQQMPPNARGFGQQPGQQPLNQQQPQAPPAQNSAQQQNSGQQMGQQPAMPATPPPPTTPLSPPIVTYKDGMLTVQAMNSTLSSVVSAIKSKTGIEFEGMDNAPERVAISLGPAPSGEVLSAIFSGSKFDFVAIGRPDSPEIVQRVILSPKKGAGTATVAGQQPKPQNSGQEGDDDDTPDETVNAGDPQDTAAQPPPTPQAQPQPDQQQSQQPKSPEQLLQELQEMRKQQEQQQQGVTPNPNQVPRKQPPLN